MAPIFPSIGITPQIIDDGRLRVLKSSLESIIFDTPLSSAFQGIEEIRAPLDIERLVVLLEPWQSWGFEEQVNHVSCACSRCQFPFGKMTHMIHVYV